MNTLATTSDEHFNEEARKADLETPVDRFYDLMLAAFCANVQEACRKQKDYPNREPDSGLVQNAAAWAQELALPDMTRNDIAACIANWISKEAEDTRPQQAIAAPVAPQNKVNMLRFM